MNGVRIRATNQPQRRDVVRGHHARVAGVELRRPTMTLELSGDLVYPLGHHQDRPVGGLRQEITHRTVETARQNDALPLLCHERKGSVDPEHCLRVTSQEPPSYLWFV
jgi:hypothetical protein